MSSKRKRLPKKQTKVVPAKTSQLKKRRPKRSANVPAPVQAAVDYLNHLLRIDPDAISYLFDGCARIYNPEIAKVPGLLLKETKQHITLLGLINGVLRAQLPKNSCPAHGPIGVRWRVAHSSQIAEFVAYVED